MHRRPLSERRGAESSYWPTFARLTEEQSDLAGSTDVHAAGDQSSVVSGRFGARKPLASGVFRKLLLGS